VFFIAGCQQNVVPSQDSAATSETKSETVGLVGETINDANVNDDIQLENVNDDIQLENVPNVPNSVVKTSVKKEPTAFEKLTLNLIQKGEQAFAAQRLLTPEDDNANLYFQAALGRDPGNFQATQGIANIVETYTDWAWLAATGRGYQKADRYLSFARSVNPEDPLIKEIDTRINDLKKKRADDARYRAQQAVIKKTNNSDNNASVETEGKEEALFPEQGVYLLPKTLFSLSDEEIIEKIQPIIDEVTKTEPSIAIYWPDDKEARLIYQIINSRVPEFRVRAMTFRRADYMVKLQQD
jgi:hypothetical protein